MNTGGVTMITLKSGIIIFLSFYIHYRNREDTMTLPYFTLGYVQGRTKGEGGGQKGGR